VVGTLQPERHDHFRRLQQALDERRHEELRAHDELLNARVVIGALQTQLEKLWDETVTDHDPRPDGEYTIDDDGRVIEVLPQVPTVQRST